MHPSLHSITRTNSTRARGEVSLMLLKGAMIVSGLLTIIVADIVLTQMGILPDLLGSAPSSVSSADTHVQDGATDPETTPYTTTSPGPSGYPVHDIKDFPVAFKPVIYLYAPKEQRTLVRLAYHGTLIADYPQYDQALGGWDVIARPDGTLIDQRDGREYSYIFWEGRSASDMKWDESKGFVMKGSEVREFLPGKLAEMGLTPREYNEFIVYWYPRLQDMPYVQIYFAGAEYTDTAPLDISPRPDALLRVFMIAKPLESIRKVDPQVFQPFQRTGFTVVEWGGTVMP